MEELNIKKDEKTGLYVWRNKNDKVIANDVRCYDEIDKYVLVTYHDWKHSLYTREGVLMPHAERVYSIIDVEPDSYTVLDSHLISHKYTTPRGKLKKAGKITSLAVLGGLIACDIKACIENKNRLAEEENAMLPVPAKLIKVAKDGKAYFDTDGNMSTAEIEAKSNLLNSGGIVIFNMQACSKTMKVSEWKRIGIQDFRKLNHENVRD